MLESDIQALIVQYLKYKNIMFFSVPNEGVNSIKRMMKLKKMGLRSGVSDLVILMKNRVIFVEVKQKGEKQTENQISFEKDVIDLGFEYHVVYSVEDVELITHCV